MSYRDAIDTQDWVTLQFVPWWVFQLVSAADSSIDTEESSLLVDVLFGKFEYENEFALEVLKSVVGEFQHVSNRYMGDERKGLEGLGDAARILASKVAPDDAKAFKDAMIDIGSKIAKAAGGFEQGEMDMLAKISSALTA